MRRERPPRTRPRCRPWARVITSRMALVSPCFLVPRMIPSSRHSMSEAFHQGAAEFKPQRILACSGCDEEAICSAGSAGKIQPHFTVALGVVAPVFAHLDEQEQMHRLFEDFADFLARRLPYRADRLALVAQHD